MSHVSRKLDQFVYFDIQLGRPDWSGKTVLDFGGNNGNLLLTPGIPIRQEDYWCIDVSSDGIADGARRFPLAHWIFYDRYNVEFHPNGSRSAEIPAPGHKFDFILAYSVFTHVTVREMDQLAGALMELLKPEGFFAFTFIDHNFRSWPDEDPVTNLEWRLDRMGMEKVRAAALMGRVAGMEWFQMAGDGDIFPGDEAIPDEARYEGLPYHVFHATSFMREHFPNAAILAPANGEMQHCCVLRKDSRRR